MEGLYRYMGITLLLLVSMVLDTLAKSVSHVDKDIFPTSYRCSCIVEVETATRGQLSYDYGQIRRYDEPWRSCKDMRHQCRDDCKERARLDKYVTEEHVDNHDKLGYTLCGKYGMPTFEEPLDVAIKASVAECPGYKPIKTKHEKLCCGLTPIPLSDNKSVKALGWDKFCTAATFVV